MYGADARRKDHTINSRSSGMVSAGGKNKEIEKYGVEVVGNE